MPVDKPRTRISEIPVANERLYGEVARLTKQEKRDVREMVEFVGEFISATIKKGEMEGVMVPYFGKFKPKKSKLIATAWNKAHKAAGTIDVVLALSGKQGRTKPARPYENPNDETI